jgi:hypothetical protein
MHGWECGLSKRHNRTRDVEVVFLHPVGFAGHVVHSDASGPRNVNALFFIFVWDRYRFHKKCSGKKRRHIIFHAYVGQVRIP